MKNLYTTTVITIIDPNTRMFLVMDYLRGLRKSRENSKPRLVLAHGAATDAYGADKPQIPQYSIVEADFVCDSGLYCIVDVGGVLHRALIPLSELHKLHYPTID